MQRSSPTQDLRPVSCAKLYYGENMVPCHCSEGPLFRKPKPNPKLNRKHGSRAFPTLLNNSHSEQRAVPYFSLQVCFPIQNVTASNTITAISKLSFSRELWKCFLNEFIFSNGIITLLMWRSCSVDHCESSCQVKKKCGQCASMA